MNLQPRKTNEATGRPWRIEDRDTSTFIDGPPEIVDHPQLGQIRVNGVRFFRLKREAQAAIDTITAGLADGSLRWKDPT